MVKKFIANLIINNAMQIGKSVIKAYRKSIASETNFGAKSGSRAESAANDGFNKMKEQMGMLSGQAMTREEALLILNIEEETKQSEPNPNMEESVPADLIMERYETLM